MRSKATTADQCCLNPYSIGICSMRNEAWRDIYNELRVLILILLEYAL